LTITRGNLSGVENIAMRVCIHRGTKEIGGTCVEIESGNKRIVLDVGLPLDVSAPAEIRLHAIRGFETLDASLLGVIISHPHLDHYGLAYRLHDQTLFLIGKAAQSILAAADLFTPSGATFENVRYLEDRTPIMLDPFTITPVLVDHSAYDAYALLVEADGKRLFYTGDLRAHGRKGALFEKLVRQPPARVDVLLMEGTTIGREDQVFPTEAALEHRLVELFQQTSGMPLVWCSGQNIDRLVTVTRACIKTGRKFIIDMYTAHVLRATGNERLPQAGWDNVKVFLPNPQRRQIIGLGEFDVANSYRPWRIFPEQLAQAAATSVMLFRPSMMQEIEGASCLAGSRLICSLWPGYLKDPKTKPLLEWLHRHGIPLNECHTSGHATVQDLVRLRHAFANAPVVPIHTVHADRFEELFGNVQRRNDGEWWTVF
jgi:ribonuclease J